MLLAPIALSLAAGLGEEAFGNDPVPNNAEWAAGIGQVANDPARVYRRWVNGNEDFCFQGDTQAANRALALLAASEAPTKRVVLLPTRGLDSSFEGEVVRFDWRLNVLSGIALSMTRLAERPRVHDQHPTLWLHVGGDVDPAALTLPEGLIVEGPYDPAILIGAGNPLKK